MNLYVDDNTCKAVLVALLRKAGHQVTVPSDVGTAGVSDVRHFLHAVTNGLLVLTKDHNDFADLHAVVQTTHGQHPGIVAIRLDNDASEESARFPENQLQIVTQIGGIGLLDADGLPDRQTASDHLPVVFHWDI